VFAAGPQIRLKGKKGRSLGCDNRSEAFSEIVVKNVEAKKGLSSKAQKLVEAVEPMQSRSHESVSAQLEKRRLSKRVSGTVTIW
jgi:hypothetical protein